MNTAMYTDPILYVDWTGVL